MDRIGVGGIITDHDERWEVVGESQHINNIGNEVCPKSSTLY